MTLTICLHEICNSLFIYFESKGTAFILFPQKVPQTANAFLSFPNFVATDPFSNNLAAVRPQINFIHSYYSVMMTHVMKSSRQLNVPSSQHCLTLVMWKYGN